MVQVDERIGVGYGLGVTLVANELLAVNALRNVVSGGTGAEQDQCKQDYDGTHDRLFPG